MALAPTGCRTPILLAVGAVLAAVVAGFAAPVADAAPPRARTPISHLVVIFQENVSFDHYFATYPRARNPRGEPRFTAAPHTPSVNGLSGGLLTANPNSAAPMRLSRSQAFTCENQHAYSAQQSAMHGGLMDRFVEFLAPKDPGCDARQVMGYFDGNTVTAMWNYAQRFTLADNFFASTIGPSTPGALNLVSGQTSGATPIALPKQVANGTVIGDPDPIHDDCSLTANDEGAGGAVSLSGRNIGDLLNARGITWGWFEGGFRPTSRDAGRAVCGSVHRNHGLVLKDYIPHHEPFQYYASTANKHHLPPTSVARIGHKDRANHQYGLGDFWRAVRGRNVPAVSFLKASHYEDGHDGRSDPLHEQRFLVQTINRLQRIRGWRSMAIVIAYDDPGGWYDHVMPPLLSQSNDPLEDTLLGPGLCGQPRPGAALDRCGHGLRLPMLVLSPYVEPNAVEHGVLDQASILRFIEDNWRLGRIGGGSFDATPGPMQRVFDFRHHPHMRPLLLDPATGRPRGR